VHLFATADPRYPVPPVGLSADHTMSVLFTCICVAFFAAMVVVAIRQAVRKDALLLACVAGGLLAGILEPMLDSLGLLWFADDNVAIANRLFERCVPLYVILGYAFFFGAQAYIVYRAILAGKSTTFFVACYAASWLFDAVLQISGAQMDLYHYYGNQPLLLGGAPMWWFTIDAGFALLAGLVFYALRHTMRGWGVLLAIPLIPCIYAGINGAVGWPVFLALQTNFDPAVNGNGSDLAVLAGGLGTIALALMVAVFAIGLIGRIVGARAAYAAEHSGAIESAPGHVAATLARA
jgi:hypothetical protein